MIFSSERPARIGRLIKRIHTEVPSVRVCGVLCERRPPPPASKRVSGALEGLWAPGGLRYAAVRLLRAASAWASSAGSALLHVVHGGRPVPEAPEDLEALCRSARCALRITTDYHGEESLHFVRQLKPDLGLVYGTRLLKPSLFTIPKHGSIKVHKRRLPDYRGDGPVGLWELLDGQSEIGVTVHQVTEERDAGSIVSSATIPIEPFDTLASLALKAQVVGNDLLVRAVADCARGTARLRPQQGPGKMFTSPTPEDLARYERELARRRPRYRVRSSRSVAKLLVKTALAAPIVTVRNWRQRRQGSHAVAILFHHLVADRPHRMALSTEHFLKHVQFLRRHYQIVSLRTAIEMLRTRSVTAPTVVLTFDDGYRENFLTLRAVVEETGIPVTMFVSTDHVARQTEFAHDSESGTNGFAPLSWDQLRQMLRDGFEVGSHTRTHFDCGSRNPAELEEQIVGSKRDLEAELCAPVEFFSFPFGLPENISPEAAQLATGAYPHVLSSFGGSNVASRTGDVKHLKRWGHPAHLWDLELQIQGALDGVPAIAFGGDARPPICRVRLSVVVSLVGGSIA